MAGRKRKTEDEGGVGKKRARAIAPITSMRVTRTMTIDGPRKAVFATAELLEEIFSHLPAKNVFAAQRVCRQFRDIVATSAKLQQKLFLRLPNGTDPEVWVLVDQDPALDHWDWHRNGKVVRVADATKPPANLVRNADGEAIFRKPVTKLNPLLNLQGIPWSEPRRLNQRMFIGDLMRVKVKSSSLTAPSSWKGTFFTDRPCKVVNVSLEWSIKARPRSHGRIEVDVMTEKPQGFTLGEALDAALDDLSDANPNRYRYYYVDHQEHRHKGSGNALIERLEREAGKKAVMGTLFATPKDVVVAREEDWSKVVDSL